MAKKKHANESELDFANRLEQIHDELKRGSHGKIAESEDSDIKQGLQALKLIQQVQEDKLCRSTPGWQPETQAIQDELTPSLKG